MLSKHGLSQPAQALRGGDATHTCWCKDWNYDGFLDLVLGNLDGTLLLFLGVGDAWRSGACSSSAAQFATGEDNRHVQQASDADIDSIVNILQSHSCEAVLMPPAIVLPGRFEVSQSCSLGPCKLLAWKYPVPRFVPSNPLPTSSCRAPPTP